MTRFIRYARGMLVALAALALTTGVTFAAREMAPAASVSTVPANGTINDVQEEVDQEVDENQDEDIDQDEDVDENQDEDVDQDEAVDENQDEDVDQDEGVTDDETAEEDGGDAKAEHPLNHGAYVSEAAHADTPEGFDNHGQWVSSVAKGTDGKSDQAAKRLAKTESKAARKTTSGSEKGAGRTKHAGR